LSFIPLLSTIVVLVEKVGVKTLAGKTDRIRQFVIEAAREAQDDNCDQIVLLDLAGISPMTDYFLICTGTSDRQIRATADHIAKLGKSRGLTLLGKDGYQQAGWILLDFVDAVIHIFSAEYRLLYDLELLWGDGRRVRWQRRSTGPKPKPKP